MSRGIPLWHGTRTRFRVTFVLCLTLGIAGAAGVFALLRQAFFHQGWLAASRRVCLMAENRELGFRVAPSPAAVEAVRQSVRSFARVEGFALDESALRGDQGATAVTVLHAASSLFTLLELEPVAGRWLAAEDPQDAAGGVLLSEGLAGRRFGSARAALGGVVTLDGRPWTVVGVFPRQLEPSLGIGDRIDVARLLDPGHHETLEVRARLRDGVTRAAAQSELDAWGQRPENASFTQEGSRWVLLSAGELLTTDALHLFRVALAGALLLVLACGVNLAHLLAAQAEHERRELATHWALGATRGRLLRRWLRAYAALPLLSGCLAALLAVSILGALGRWAPESLKVVQGAQVDAAVVAFAILASYLVLFFFAALVALRGPRRFARDLREDPRRGRPHRLGRALGGLHVVTMVALAFVLAVAAHLVLASVAQLRRTNWGFEPVGVQALRVQLPRERYTSPAACKAFFSSLSEQLALDPRLRRAAWASELPPATGFLLARSEVVGAPAGQALPSPIGYVAVGPGYFSTLGQPMLAGRELTEADLAAGAAVAVVSQAVAKRLGLSARELLGKPLRVGGALHEIVGVAGSVETPGPLKALDGLQLYLPLSQHTQVARLVLRTEEDVAATVRQMVHRLEADAVVDQAEMTTLVARASAQTHFLTVLFSTLTAMAIGLALLGVYGVLLLQVAQQRSQIALRLALGAGRGHLRGWLLGQSLRQVGAGLLAGLLISYPFCRLLADQLFGIAAGSPTPRLAAALAILALAGITTLLPLRRAGEIAAHEVLKQE